MILQLRLNEITRYLTELFMLSGQMELLEETKSHISIGFSPGLSEGKVIYSEGFRFEYLVNNKLQLFHLPSIFWISR